MERWNSSRFLLVGFLIYLVLLDSRTKADDRICQGAFDVYFVLDKSSSLIKGRTNHFKEETVSFVSLLSDKFVSPLSRLSYITFSTTAEIIMPLTSDRLIMEKKLEQLKDTIPDGPTLLYLGLKKANDQIAAQRDQRASVIIVLTDGKLDHPTKVQSVTQADRARKYGSTLYVIGVSNYDRRQLLDIAGGIPRCVFQVKDFTYLDTIVKEILLASCIEVLSVDPVYVCSNETFQVTVHGKGFNITGNPEYVRCNFWTERLLESSTIPDQIHDEYLMCSSPDGFALEADETSTILVSVNGGISFISSNVTITGLYCVHSGFGFWVVMLLLLVLLLFGLWWISDLCCSRAKQTRIVSESVKKEDKTPVEATPEAQHWPSVDASRYGAGGVGGIKPMEVRWGDKGCTEAAMHLERASDAREIQVVRRTNLQKNVAESDVAATGCLMAMMGAIIRMYREISSRRPSKDEMARCIFIRKRPQRPSEGIRRSYLDTAQ